MKRFKAILLCLVLSFMAFGAMGCDDKEKANAPDEFVEVMSVTYTANGETFTYQSKIEFETDSQQITNEEYDNFDSTHKLFDRYNYHPLNNIKLKKDKTFEQKFTIGEYYAYGTYPYREYYKFKEIGRASCRERV